MKKSLQEDLKRIHTLTYGTQVIEEGFLDNILKAVGLKKTDDPKKADLVSDDVTSFFKTLEDAATSGGLSQQQKGGMSFQKNVESMQIGLKLLGYELPRYGVDGLFGPETASAVTKFINDHPTKLNEASAELRSTLSDLGYQEKSGQLTGGGEITDDISGVVSDILRDFKATNPKVKVIVTSGNDKFHKKLGYNSTHKVGQAVDLVIQPYNSANAKSFINILNKYKSTNPKFNYIDEYTNPSAAATGGHFHLQYGGSVAKGGGGENVTMVTATPEMITTLIKLLKERGVSPEDLKKNIDTINVSNLEDKNFYAKLLENLGAPITDENMKFMYAWRQAEGKGGTYNPFNTTWKMPNSTVMNSHGVRNYSSMEDGLVATVKTLRNGRYECIVNGLKNDIGASNIARCESLKTWGTGDLVAKVVNSYNNGANPKISSLA
jgi:hypothetical protein